MPSRSITTHKALSPKLLQFRLTLGVTNKLDLLNNMRGAGVWLLDASVTALYGNGIKLTKRDYRAVLKACWRYHIREVLCGCEPSAVLIVGRGVHDAIGDCVRKALGVGVEVDEIYQPNAHQFGEVDRRKCFNLCCRHRACIKTGTSSLTASGHGLPLRRGWYHGRCAPDSRRLAAPPRSAAPGHKPPFNPGSSRIRPCSDQRRNGRPV
jgi:hypothetical protein